VQASIGWTQPTGALGRLTEAAHERVRVLLPDAQRLEAAARLAARGPSFANALRDTQGVAVIAEIKRRSPSKGEIAASLSAADQAQAYAAGGAAAISVLTEEREFGGTLADLDAAAPARIPRLRKDFIVDRLQMLEAVIHGASAVLLIVRALPADRLAELMADASALGLDALVEVHTERELHGILGLRPAIIGVNNRDLETLEVDDSASTRLIPMIPAASLAVYESGIRTRGDVERAASLGADAVLVGTALSSSGDATSAVRALVSVRRHRRHAA